MDSSIIGILNTCFWICLSFAILFFLLSIVLFFVFDIIKIFNIKTGRAKAKTVKEMKAANESTGRLRIDGKTQTSKLTEEEKSLKRAPAVAPPESNEENKLYSGGSDETELLYSNQTDNALNYAETSVLSSDMLNTSNYTVQNDSATVEGFRIIKNIMLIHTNERI